MIFSPQTILSLLLGTTLLCSQAEDTCPDVKLTGVGESDKLTVLRGCPGIPGYPGLQGPLGPQGHEGDQGAPGITGDKGLAGEKGDRGYPGQMGPIGRKGAQGGPGRTGDRGQTGAKGDQGDPGRTGDRGQTGAKGDQGAPGSIGDRGLTGEKGDQGAPGSTGNRGPTGEKGSKGEKGASYSAIYGGDQGATGITGVSGLSGKKGAKNCKELRDQGIAFSGWYTIHPDGMKPLVVLCDMVAAGGGWIVFQRRMDGSVDFYQDWETYKRGFGSQLSEFWLGNENIHRLTSKGKFQLRVDLEDFENNRTYATYKDFSIDGEEDFYKLKLGDFIEGTAGDSLRIHSYRGFSTNDKEDYLAKRLSLQFPKYYKGAWWFSVFTHSHLNGEYVRGKPPKEGYGIIWPTFRGKMYSLRSSEMKFRPV